MPMGIVTWEEWENMMVTKKAVRRRSLGLTGRYKTRLDCRVRGRTGRCRSWEADDDLHLLLQSDFLLSLFLNLPPEPPRILARPHPHALQTPPFPTGLHCLLNVCILLERASPADFEADIRFQRAHELEAVQAEEGATLEGVEAAVGGLTGKWKGEEGADAGET